MGYVICSLDWQKFKQLVERPTAGQLGRMAGFLRDALDEYGDSLDTDDPVLTWASAAAGPERIIASRLAMPDWYGDLSNTGKTVWELVVFDTCTCEDIEVGLRAESDGGDWDVLELPWKELGVVPEQVSSSVALSAFGQRPYRYHAPIGTQGQPPVRTPEQLDSWATRRSSIDALRTVLDDLARRAKEGRADLDQLLQELEQREDILAEHRQFIVSVVTGKPADNAAADEEWKPMHSMHVPEEAKNMLAELRSIESRMLKVKDKEARQQYLEELVPAIERIAGEGGMLFVQVDT